MDQHHRQFADRPNGPPQGAESPHSISGGKTPHVVHRGVGTGAQEREIHRQSPLVLRELGGPKSVTLPALNKAAPTVRAVHPRREEGASGTRADNSTTFRETARSTANLTGQLTEADCAWLRGIAEAPRRFTLFRRPGHRPPVEPGPDPSQLTPSHSCPRSADGPRKPLIGCRTTPTTRTCEFKSDQAGGSCPRSTFAFTFETSTRSGPLRLRIRGVLRAPVPVDRPDGGTP